MSKKDLPAAFIEKTQAVYDASQAVYAAKKQFFNLAVGLFKPGDEVFYDDGRGRNIHVIVQTVSGREWSEPSLEVYNPRTEKTYRVDLYRVMRAGLEEAARQGKGEMNDAVITKLIRALISTKKDIGAVLADIAPHISPEEAEHYLLNEDFGQCPECNAWWYFRPGDACATCGEVA